MGMTENIFVKQKNAEPPVTRWFRIFFALPVSQCLLFSKNHSSAGTMNAAGIYAVA